VIHWPEHPDQINPAMLDDIAERVAAASPLSSNTNKQSVLAMINTTINEHYHKGNANNANPGT